MEESWEDGGEAVVVEEDGPGGWEEILPRGPVRVLLVESDDSTRQIIAALLRKCSYRVSVASDGLKAWETLKEKSHNIDLVLTEVELPSISGFALLTMIMDHKACKSIPVIMMSSHDSISMVFKYMLKGAADFLVKPIRKNELRNLWQHVWRRQISSGHGGTHGHPDEILGKKKLDDHSREYVASMQENEECSEKGSSAQSSCTRSEMEAESKYMQNMLDIKQPKSRDLSLKEGMVAQNGDDHIESDSAPLMHEGEAEDMSIMLGSEVTRFNGACNLNKPTLEDERTCAVIQTMNKDNPSKEEVIDLIGAIDNQPQHSYVPRGSSAVQNGISDPLEILFHEKDVKSKSSSMPVLELSLKRYQQSNCEKSETDEWNTLNHSNFSAFSQYNSRTAVPMLTPMNSVTERKECFSTSTKALPDQDYGNASNAHGLSPNMNLGDTNSLGLGPTSQGATVGCSPLRVIPFPIPIRGMPSDNLCAGYGTLMQPIYYPQAAYPLWSTVPSMWQEVVHTNTSHQSGPKDLSSVQSDHRDDHSPKSVIDHPTQKQEENKELGDEGRHVSSVMGDSGSSSVCNVSRSHLNISGSGSLCDTSKGNNTAANISEANTGSGNVEGQFTREGIKRTDFHHLNQREAALNKFRLKRKERCYEKKVRYHSRKRLAEQRPRVKGQFVRQVQPDP